ncbi:RSCA1 protein, partial [Eurystomus gularis]|nr:RSCA1 protein [Eurystomus gularis]
PSLPASDGFQNPVQSSGLNSKICNPTNQLLDRSVSAPASICSSESSLTEPVDPRAVKSSDSSTECQIAPEEERPLLLQHLSNNASLANNDPSPQTGEVTCCDPACLSQKTLKETFIADSLKECNAKEQDRGREHPLEVTKENSLADTAAKHGQKKDVGLSLEQERKHELPIDHQTFKDPGKEHLEEQTETTDPEPPCHVGGVEKPVVEGASWPENPPMETRGDVQEKARLPCATGSIQVSASRSCMQTEAFMEIDVVESVAEAHSSESKHKWQAENRSVSDPNSDTFSMEIESLKSASCPGDTLSTGGVAQSKSTAEIPARCNELSDLVAEDSCSPSSIPQLDTEPGRPLEEPCSSLASALKELHKLLIISQKGESKILAAEEFSQLELRVHKEPAARQKELSEGEQKGSDPAGQEECCSFYEVSSEGGRAEGKRPCDSSIENTNVGSVSHMQSALGEGALEIQEFSGKSDLVVVNSAATSDQQQSSEQAEVLAEGSQSPTRPTLEQSTSVSSIPALGEGAAQDTQSLFTGVPGRSSSSAPEGPWPLEGCEEPLMSPPAGYPGLTSGAPPPPAFPAADVDRILSAGFTTREALEALEQADGNADLALLILLAKSIVVPS